MSMKTMVRTSGLVNLTYHVKFVEPEPINAHPLPRDGGKECRHKLQSWGRKREGGDTLTSAGAQTHLIPLSGILNTWISPEMFSASSSCHVTSIVIMWHHVTRVYTYTSTCTSGLSECHMHTCSPFHNFNSSISVNPAKKNHILSTPTWRGRKKLYHFLEPTSPLPTSSASSEPYFWLSRRC